MVGGAVSAVGALLVLCMGSTSSIGTGVLPADEWGGSTEASILESLTSFREKHHRSDPTYQLIDGNRCPMV